MATIQKTPTNGIRKPTSVSGTKSVPVTADNFIRAKSDLYFRNVEHYGGFGKFHHNHTPTTIGMQTVIRINQDTLYSGGVFDLDASPVTIMIPDAGKRFRAMQAVTEDCYCLVASYRPGNYTFTRNEIRGLVGGCGLISEWR